jgi:hypothetical protein
MLQEIHTYPTLAAMDNNMAHLREMGSRAVYDASAKGLNKIAKNRLRSPMREGGEP